MMVVYFTGSVWTLRCASQTYAYRRGKSVRSPCWL